MEMVTPSSASMIRAPFLAICFLCALARFDGDVRAAGPAELARLAPLSFRLADSTGAIHTERELTQTAAAVLFFITPDCPISQGYVPEMNRLADAYRSRGIGFFAVQADLTASEADVRRHVTEYGYRFPVLLDAQQQLVRRTGATVTPEAVVITAGGSVLYQGRIDNRIVSLGKKRPQATEFDLRDALDAVLAHRPVVHPRTTAYGCLISRAS
jgi:thiol-disulfide isomerase/thioredoxin